MSATIDQLVADIDALSDAEREQVLVRLAGLDQADEADWDEWDRQIELDALPGGPLERLIRAAEAEIAAGQVWPLDEIMRDE